MVPERSRVDDDALATHNSELSRPEVVPLGVVLLVGNARVKPNLFQGPPALGANRLREGKHVIIRVGIAEGVFG